MALYNQMTPQTFNQQQFNPAMPKQSSVNRKEGFLTKASPFIDVAQFGLNFIPGWGQVASLGLEAIQKAGDVQQKRYDEQYEQQYQLEQNQFQNEMNQQTNPYSMYRGGKKKTMMQRMLDEQSFNNSNNYLPNTTDSNGQTTTDGTGYKLGGLKRSEDYGSKSKPYPSVASTSFAGPHRSYPIPTHADAVDALRLAGLHGASGVKQKVYARYPDLRPGMFGGGLMGLTAKQMPGQLLNYPMNTGGNYGMIPGQGNSKADDKQVNMKDGSYVIPNDSNSQNDPKIAIAKSLLAFLGHDSDKKFDMQKGGNPDANISSKEMVLNPKQSDQFDQVMGGEMQKEAFFTPESPYNNSFGAGMNQMPGTMMMPQMQMPGAGNMMLDNGMVYNNIAYNKGGGKKGLMNLAYQGGGPVGDEKAAYAEKMKQQAGQLGEEELDKIINAQNTELTLEQSQDMFGFPRQGETYKTGEIAPAGQLDLTSPDYYDPITGMTNREKSVKQQEDILSKIPAQGVTSSYEMMTPQQQSEYNRVMGITPDQTTQVPTDLTQTTPSPTAKTTTGADPFEEASRMNKLVHGLEAGAVVGMGLYNLLTKYQPGQKPLEYNPLIQERDFMGLQNDLEKQTQLAGATARYNARNVNQTPLTNAAIHANELQQLNKNAATINDLQQQDKLRVTDQKNQATLYNLANMNQYTQMEQEQRNQFRLQKGQVLSENISTLSEIGKDYASNKILIDTAQKGTNVDRVFKEYMNWKTYEKMKDPNNPIVKKDEKGQVIYKKDAQGNPTGAPEYYEFTDYLSKSGL